MALTATASFRTTPELKERVKTLALETRRSEGFIYNCLLEEYLDDLEDILLSEEVLADIRSGKDSLIPTEDVFAKSSDAE